MDNGQWTMDNLRGFNKTQTPVSGLVRPSTVFTSFCRLYIFANHFLILS
jgi:hypothetical protein